MITPAQTFLKNRQIPYTPYTYQCTVDHDYGKFGAQALGIPEERVFKTIILVGEHTYVTAITPVNAMISLKNAARLCQLKSLELASAAEVTRVTGYVLGGVSPFGQKRPTRCLLCESALQFPEILVSGGRRGFSVGVAPADLVAALEATVGDFLDHRG